MASPSSSLATLRPDLSQSLEQFDLAMDREGFFGLRLCPVLTVSKAAGTYGKIPLKELLQTRNLLRAPDGSYSRGKFNFTDASYTTIDRGTEEPIDDNEAAMYESFFVQELVSTQRCEDALLRGQEMRIVGLLTDPAIYTGDLAVLPDSSGSAIPWTDHANCTPIDDVLKWKHRVWTNCGLWPNVMGISKFLFDHLARSEQILSQVKYNGLMDVVPGRISIAAIGECLGIALEVEGSAKNTANAGQIADLSPIFPVDKAILARVAHTADPKEPCVARTFHWPGDGSTEGGTVETYRDEAVRSDIVRIRHQVQEQSYYAECSVLATGLWEDGVEGFSI